MLKISLWPSGSVAGLKRMYVLLPENSRLLPGGGCIYYYYHASLILLWLYGVRLATNVVF